MNNKIYSQLSLLSNKFNNDNKKFKSIALKKAMKNIEEHKYKIISGNYAKNNIINIGQGIADRIDEILEHGCLKELQNENINMEIINKLQQISGVGPKKATELVNQGISTIEELKHEIDIKNINVNHHINIGIKYYNDINLKIPRSEIDFNE